MPLEANPDPAARLVGGRTEPPEQLMVGTPEEFDAVHPLPVQFMRMNWARVPIGLRAFCAWIVLGNVAGLPELGSCATANENVSRAMMDKMRFINSSFH